MPVTARPAIKVMLFCDTPRCNVSHLGWLWMWKHIICGTLGILTADQTSHLEDEDANQVDGLDIEVFEGFTPHGL